MKDLAALALQALKDAGAEESQVVLSRTEKVEVSVAENKITMMRTLFNTSGNLKVILDGKTASQAVNGLTGELLREAATEVTEMARGSQSDPANAVAELEDGPTQYSAGPESADREKILVRLEEFLATLAEKAPAIQLMESSLHFERRCDHWASSKGMTFEVKTAHYQTSFTFCAVEGERSSSMNGSGAVSYNLDTPLWDWGGLGDTILQNVEELKARPLGEKFTGDVVFAPGYVGELLQAYAGTFLSTTPLMTGASLLKDSLNKAVAHESVTVVSNPSDPALCTYPLTSDGFRAKDMTVMENGVLKSFVLGQYGALKTGQARSANEGDHLCLLPGDKSHEDIIKSIGKGLLVCRFSGGIPSDNGDFSGVAKNSFYIENGKIAFPVNETMISGNLLELLKNVEGISSDTVSDGDTRQPWLHVGGVVIS